MRIFVTGAGGFVGAHLVRHLIDHGDDVIASSRRPAANNGYVVVDLLDTGRVAAILSQSDPEAIIHLAGYADAGRSYVDSSSAWRDNLDATLSLYRAIDDWGGRPSTLAVSSGMVYGTPVGECNESTPLLPNSPYAASKAAADLAGYQAFCHPGIPIIRVRPFNQIGPGQSPRYAAANFARQIAAIERGDLPPIIETGDLSAVRDVMDVRDMVVVYRKLLDHGVPGEAYNAATGSSISMGELLQRLLEQTRVNVTVTTDINKIRPTDVAPASVSVKKLCVATRWHPQIPLAQTLSDILADWRLR